MADYSAQPRPAPLPNVGGESNRGKYRGPLPGGLLSAGLMADPRVLKGSNYNVRQGDSGKSVVKQGVARAQGKRASKTRWTEARIPTPPPVEGRINCLLQTDEYIEILANQSSLIQQTQTNAIMDRPSEPLFNRIKRDNDMTTQIEIGDIFAFDVEVEPVLEVLMRTTMRKFVGFIMS